MTWFGWPRTRIQRCTILALISWPSATAARGARGLAALRDHLELWLGTVKTLRGVLVREPLAVV